MSDSIIVRVTLDAYDMASTGRQTQVYVQVPEVARASWLLSSDLFHRLKDRPWPEVLDVVHEYVTYGGLASNSSATAAWAAVRKWLSEDANRDEMQAAFEEHEARQHPVARKLLAENERLRARVAELLAERHTTNEALSDAAERMRADRDRIAELEALAAAAMEFRLVPAPPAFTPLTVCRDRAYDGTQWAVLHDPGDRAVRRAWTEDGWEMTWALSHGEIFCWPDVVTALAQAKRAQGEDDENDGNVDGIGRTPESYRDRPQADAITRRIAPTQALREAEDVTPQVTKLQALLAGQRAAVEGEHYPTVHHDYRVPRDLPEAGDRP